MWICCSPVCSKLWTATVSSEGWVYLGGATSDHLSCPRGAARLRFISWTGNRDDEWAVFALLRIHTQASRSQEDKESLSEIHAGARNKIKLDRYINIYKIQLRHLFFYLNLFLCGFFMQRDPRLGVYNEYFTVILCIFVCVVVNWDTFWTTNQIIGSIYGDWEGSMLFSKRDQCDVRLKWLTCLFAYVFFICFVLLGTKLVFPVMIYIRRSWLAAAERTCIYFAP